MSGDPLGTPDASGVFHPERVAAEVRAARALAVCAGTGDAAGLALILARYRLERDRVPLLLALAAMAGDAAPAGRGRALAASIGEDGAVSRRAAGPVLAAVLAEPGGFARMARSLRRLYADQAGAGLDEGRMAAMVAEFAAALALHGLAAVGLAFLGADLVAAQIRGGLEDGAGLGEWLWELLGDETAERVRDLTGELAGLTRPAPAAEAGRPMSGAERWRRRSGEVEARRLTRENLREVWEWADSKPHFAPGERGVKVCGEADGLSVYVGALGERLVAAFGDWVYRDGEGRFGTLDDAAFRVMFEPVTREALDPLEAVRVLVPLWLAEAAAKRHSVPPEAHMQAWCARELQLALDGLPSPVPDGDDEAYVLPGPQIDGDGLAPSSASTDTPARQRPAEGRAGAVPSGDVMDLLETAWHVMANVSGGDWDYQESDWREAAERWRDRYHEVVRAYRDQRDAACDEAAVPPLPRGTYARVELPGWRNHTGWITEEARFGATAAVVRDRDGREVASVVLGPGCQVLPLAEPVTRPGPAAITIGGQDDDGDGNDGDDDLDPAGLYLTDNPGGYDEHPF